MLTVQIVLFEGFDLLDAMAPYEVFSAASLHADRALSVRFVTAEGPRSVASGMNGLKIEASAGLNPRLAGIILVPGAAGDADGDGPDSVPAILGRAMNTEITDFMRQAFEQKDIVVATVCGGSLMLAMGGLLEGRRAVTHRLGMEVLGATGAVPVPARVVDDGNLVTGGGVTSGLDVALYLVERELGPRIAHEVERLFEYERRGTVWKETGLEPRRHPLPGSDDRNPATDSAPIDRMELANPIGPASAFDGLWDTTIATPIGKMEVKLSIRTSNGSIQGQAVQGDETVAFIDPVLRADKLTWLLPITKPMRLNLKFEATVDGNFMTGTAKAGILPASALAGTRRI